MNTEQQIQKLIELNEYERAGKYIFDKTGKEMIFTYIDYIDRAGGKISDFKSLLSDETVKHQNRLYDEFVPQYASGLTESAFIADGKNIEIEKLLRYVYIPRHKHNFFELVCVLNGECTHLFGTHSIIHGKGDITIIPPEVEHELHGSPDCVCITIKIRRSTFLDSFSKILKVNSVLSSYFMQTLELPYYRSALTFHSKEDIQVYNAILGAYSQQEEALLYSDNIIEYLFQLLLIYLIQNYRDTMEFLVEEDVQNSKIVDILNYIFENYQTISLNETASHFYISVPYLSATIHKATGKTFSDLLRDYKLKMAAGFLIQTNKKLDEICEEIGYKDTSQFIKSFKEKYGFTPAKYRKAKQND